MIRWIQLHSTDWETMIPVALVFGFSAAWLASRRRDALIPWLTLVVCLASWIAAYALNDIQRYLSFGRPYWGAIVVTLSIGVVLQVGAVLGGLALARSRKWNWTARGTVAAFAGVLAIPVMNLVSEHLYPSLFELFSQMPG